MPGGGHRAGIGDDDKHSSADPTNFGHSTWRCPIFLTLIFTDTVSMDAVDYIRLVL